MTSAVYFDNNIIILMKINYILLATALLAVQAAPNDTYAFKYCEDGQTLDENPGFYSILHKIIKNNKQAVSDLMFLISILD